ncbi:MAG: L,D-transpeptidase family protein, partial [Oligoflexia bacterium]|nr:L,D-transpeptidase family protein [Oligoflexia bacterium]
QEAELVIVSKSKGQLRIIKNSKNNFLTVEEIFVSYGKKPGDKKLSGDKKTPAGAYFVTEIIPRQELKDMYGAGALPLNYPNPIDELTGKKGNSIWIHGTDNTERLSSLNNTNGCLVMNNDRFNSLVRHIRLNKTPVLITDEFTDVHLRKTRRRDFRIVARQDNIFYRVINNAKTGNIVYEKINRNM